MSMLCVHHFSEFGFVILQQSRRSRVYKEHLLASKHELLQQAQILQAHPAVTLTAKMKNSPFIIHLTKQVLSQPTIHRLINVIDYCFISKLGAMVVSLDAEKAFEQVNCRFSLELEVSG